jgi:hypothetical protein
MLQESRSLIQALGTIGCLLFALGCNQNLPTVPVSDPWPSLSLSPPPSPSPSPSPSPKPSPSPSPGPTPGTQYRSTPEPFNLSESRTFDILGWDSWPRAPTPTAIQFRWNADTGKYEVLAPGYAGWNRLEALPSRFGTPYDYDVFNSDWTKLPFHMPVFAPPHFSPMNPFVGNARIFEGNSAVAYFAFGIATAEGDVPLSGTMTCAFGEDEIGEGAVTFDLKAGTVSGWAEPFWVRHRYDLVQTSFSAGATTFATKYGTGGVLEGRFFGPGAVNVAIRAKGDGPGFSAVTGIMNGSCVR